jgi:hypothetical protein
MWHAWERKGNFTGFLWERGHLEDQDLNGSKWILGKLAWGIEYIQLCYDRGLWQAVVYTVKDLRVLASQS